MILGAGGKVGFFRVLREGAMLQAKHYWVDGEGEGDGGLLRRGSEAAGRAED